MAYEFKKPAKRFVAGFCRTFGETAKRFKATAKTFRAGKLSGCFLTCCAWLFFWVFERFFAYSLKAK